MQSFLRVLRPARAPRASGSWTFAGATLLAAFGPAPTSVAQPTLAALPQLRELAELDLEQLARISVTSVTLREQRLADAPAAIYVISAEDIRRSGVTSLPEALRLAPNLLVARADANQYAISARGFNNVLANKMLVLIDGRTVYSPLFSGVFWEAQQVMLEDVERIEVISGPGATLWGANAVNGVINVITRRAEETQGALVVAGGGNRERGGAARWGGAIGGDGHYRIYAQAGDRRHTELETGGNIVDGSTSAQAGFRADWGGARSRMTLQGDAYRNDIEQQAGGSRDLRGANVIGRWTRTFDGSHYLNVQGYYDRVERDQPTAIRERLDTWDIEVHHGLQLTPSQRLLWGGGYRWMHDDLRNLAPALALLPPTRNLHRGHVFAQDEIALPAALALTLGLKFEHNNYTGWEVLPDARLAWRPTPEQMVWGAASRAVRSPARVDREFYVPANPPFIFAGGPAFESEVAEVYEIGYRAQPTAAASYSLSVFHHDFDRLKTTEPGAGGAVNENRMTGKIDGINGWGSYRVSPRWRMTAGFNWMRERRHLDAGSASIGGTAAAGNDPSSWFHVGAALDLTARLELDVRARRIQALPNGPVPAYTAVDARVGWKPLPAVEISLSVQNLLDAGHPEWGGPANRAEIERSVFVKVLWRM
jgi:iron complex outermembrane receptor protein